MKLYCPKCSSAFTRFIGTSAVCENGHAYDRAREGYYNLLLQTAGGTHGDNREMLLSRRTFLDTGAYLPLANLITDTAISMLSHTLSPSVLDIGCGEGYYTEKIYNSLLTSGKTPKLCAFDISRDAVKLTAKRLPKNECELAVASAYHVPAPDESFDVAFNMFSPLCESEIFRVLKKDGVFIMAIPDADHLYELKAEIYDNPYKNELSDFKLDGFSLISVQPVKYKIKLNSNEKILSLFYMTPYAYRTKETDKKRLFSLSELEVTASFVVITYKKSC
jgi:23S rRNA (guanine745-N1)-methyltransferase